MRASKLILIQCQGRLMGPDKQLNDCRSPRYFISMSPTMLSTQALPQTVSLELHSNAPIGWLRHSTQQQKIPSYWHLCHLLQYGHYLIPLDSGCSENFSVPAWNKRTVYNRTFMKMGIQCNSMMSLWIYCG